MSTTTLDWRDQCEHCGGDLPLAAPTYQKFCCVECRFKAYEKYQIQNRQDLYARRRQGRLDAKKNRPPCAECGTTIPLHKNATARFCSDLCQRRNYDRRCAAKQREARLAKRAERRARRRALPESSLTPY